MTAVTLAAEMDPTCAALHAFLGVLLVANLELCRRLLSRSNGKDR